MRSIRTVCSQLSFGEAPRWRAGEGLYFSDIYAQQVLRLDAEARLEVVAEFDGPVSGLGWLPDGRLLVVSMLDRRVLRVERDGVIAVHAELGEVATWHANDMIVDDQGVAYVGNYGFSLVPPEAPRPAKLARVGPDGVVSVAASDLMFPNGSALTPDGRTLIIAESATRRLTAFSIGDDGTLVDRRVWAELPGAALPDGICLDAEGAVWVASPYTREALRIAEGGAVLDRIETEQLAVAVVLGGEDRRTLFICTAESTDPDACKTHRTGRLLAVEVEVAGAGVP